MEEVNWKLLGRAEVLAQKSMQISTGEMKYLTQEQIDVINEHISEAYRHLFAIGVNILTAKEKAGTFQKEIEELRDVLGI